MEAKGGRGPGLAIIKSTRLESENEGLGFRVEGLGFRV